ncbi:hypothetical protein fugu_015535 [Takifugu bimaculatus]|uniref:EGF-like domain-containing protein n=1 Tax=Takifugu bimaculatus TaxID=433685 RepID=A0A4Z2BYZ2_9TELE|nr:hypothetical protein fugu_015535 [Takifugu bimaculatus]
MAPSVGRCVSSHTSSGKQRRDVNRLGSAAAHRPLFTQRYRAKRLRRGWDLLQRHTWPDTATLLKKESLFRQPLDSGRDLGVTMCSSTTCAALLCLLAGAVAAVRGHQSVFLDKQQASSLISRQKRDAAGSTLEKVCMEKVCTYEQARAFFQDSYRTDIFWAVYVDGDQCAEKPCQNGAMCSDSVGGYDCVCKSGFTGVHCEKDETLCVVDSDKGCSQFCKPGYTSFVCSWRFPCGKVTSVSQWESRMATNKLSNFEGVSCASGECPWQALLKSSESAGFCSGVILKEKLVLTSAQCVRKFGSFQVAVGKRTTGFEAGEQTVNVKQVHVHPRFVEGRPDNDLAVIELSNSIRYNKDVTAACLPEKDFAENVLMPLPTIITGWKEGQGGKFLTGSTHAQSPHV